LGGIGVEDCCGVSVGLGDAVSLGGADSSAVAEPFFRCGDGLEVGVGVAELFFFFLDVADCDSSSSTGVDFFFFGEGDAEGVGELSSSIDDDFFEGVGVGDFCFVDAVAVFFRGFGVGVGVEKIFLRAPPRDWSAGLVVSIGRITRAIKMKMRKTM